MSAKSPTSIDCRMRCAAMRRAGFSALRRAIFRNSGSGVPAFMIRLISSCTESPALGRPAGLPDWPGFQGRN